jgi:hypothetical protein
VATSAIPLFDDAQIRTRAAQDVWLSAVTLAWLNLALLIGAVGAAGRHAGLLILAAIGLAPAFVSSVGRLHPSHNEAYGIPGGIYLLCVAHVARQSSVGRRWAASAIAMVGALALVWFSLDRALEAGLGPATVVSGVLGLGLVAWGTPRDGGRWSRWGRW